MAHDYFDDLAAQTAERIVPFGKDVPIITTDPHRDRTCRVVLLFDVSGHVPPGLFVDAARLPS